MRFRYLLLTLLVPAMIACAKDDKNNEENNENPQEKPEEPIEEDAWVIVGLGNDWNTEVAMTKDSKDPNLWTASVTLGAEENEGGIKFRTKGDSEWKGHQFGIDPAAETNTLEFSKKVSTSSVKLVADDGASKNIILRPGEHEYQFKLYVDGDKKGVFTATMTLTDDDIYAPEITNGAKVLACNRDVEKFLTDIQYPTHDYSYSSLRTWAEQNGIAVCPGNSDKPEEYSIRWAADPAAGDVVVTISEPDRSREYTVSSSEHTLTISNLLPNTHYTYQAKAGSKVLTEGSFDTYGKVHQLHFRTQVRNCRDLGGWKTQDGKTVKYRQVYRGGRLERPTSARPARPTSSTKASRPSSTSVATATFSPRVPSRASSMTTSSAPPSSKRVMRRCSTTTRRRPASACSSSWTASTSRSPSTSTAPSDVTVPAPSPC